MGYKLTWYEHAAFGLETGAQVHVLLPGQSLQF